MDDVTDTVFRQMIADCASPDLFFTEFVNVDGLESPGRPKLLKKLQFTKTETPIFAQIWGKNPENYYKVAKELKEMGFSGVDINMGCPVKVVMKQGCCAALIDNRGLAGEIITAVKEAAGENFPISIKTRVGNKTVDMSWIEYLLQHKLNMLTIHGRTAKQQSAVPADWQLIAQARELRDHLSPTTLIVGNGDVINRQQGEELAKQYGLDGIMIGRGVFSDPYVFAAQSPWESMGVSGRKALYAKHVKLFSKTWSDHQRRIQTLNKFCKIYINGFDGAKELREKLMKTQSTDELLELLKD